MTPESPAKPECSPTVFMIAESCGCFGNARDEIICGQPYNNPKNLLFCGNLVADGKSCMHKAACHKGESHE